MKEILNAIEAIGKWLGGDPTAIVIFLVPALGLIYWRFKYYQDVLKSPLGLAGVRERLTAHGGWRKAYFGHLRRTLAWVDKGVGPSAWSTDSYEFTLTMAVIYPFTSLFLVWVITGHDTSGIITLLPNDLPLWHRALILLAACIATFFYYKDIASKVELQRLIYAICGASMLATACIVVNPTGAVSLVFLGGVNAIVLTFALTLAGHSVFTGAAALAAAVAGAVAASFYTVAVPVFVAAAGTFVILFIQTLMRWLRLKRLFYLLFVPFALCLLASLSAHPDWLGSTQKVSSFIIIFFALLPLTNSIFDWLSLASTRWLLKSIAARDHASALLVAGNAIAGLGFGGLLLAGLAVAITVALQTLNLLSQNNGGPELFDLASTLYLLQTTPYDVSVWWVYFTLFSTMLPTVFHATVASASFVTWRLPDSWKTHWLNLIGPTKDIKDDHPLLVGMSLRMTAIDVLTVILATLGTAFLSWMLFWVMPYEGRDLLWLCEKVAEWLGAPITV